MAGDQGYVDSTTSVRMFKSDAAVLRRRVARESAKRNRDVVNAELLHELMAVWRLEDSEIITE